MKWIREFSFFIGLFLLLVSLLTSNELAGYAVTFLIMILAFFNQKAAILTIVVYFPIRPFLLEMNEGLKYLGDGLIVTLFFIALITKIFSNMRFSKNYLFSIFFIAFCVIGSISAWITGVQFVSILFQIRAFMITFLLIFIISELKLTKRDIINFLLVTVSLATILCVHGLIEKISLRTFLLPSEWSEMNLARTNFIRIYGLTGNPNILATFLMIAFFSTLYLKEKLNHYKYALYGGAILIFGVILLTYSRGTLLAFGAAYFCYIFFTRQWKKTVVHFMIVIVSMFVVYYPTVYATGYVENQMKSDEVKDVKPKRESSNHNRYLDMFSQDTVDKSSEGGRIYIVKKGLEIFKEHPLIGTGFGTFGDSASWAHGSPIAEKYGIQGPIYSDNQYIQILVQTGLFGTVLFSIFILTMVMTVQRTHRRKREKWLFYSLLMVGVIGSAVYNMLEDKTFTVYFYIILGFMLNSYDKKDELIDASDKL